ncbi:hypothetical protein MAPG_01836 [Magnaporthiopsis poae ATCC 64411]|uniref:Uncharacterized protein n=1 Tax=Magnaporthiopsis poae (strain ATCC 64411 / 73-15) TaxID=644358 RepID=A0A0C4DPR4_MAGP6|nr:hypothetical protein MAPG_01836 [Magnaporthiopsis poae ATCC 64411]
MNDVNDLAIAMSKNLVGRSTRRWTSWISRVVSPLVSDTMHTDQQLGDAAGRGFSICREWNAPIAAKRLSSLCAGPLPWTAGAAIKKRRREDPKAELCRH